MVQVCFTIVNRKLKRILLYLAFMAVDKFRANLSASYKEL